MNRTALFIIGSLALIIIAMVVIKPPAEPKKVTPPAEILRETVPVKKTGFKLAPEFSLKDANGIERKLSDFKGSVVIIDFWATWCPPCKEEMRHFVELYSQYKDHGLEIIGVSMDQNPQKIIPRFIEKNNINYTILFGEDEVYDLYGGIRAIPTTFIVDRNGNLVKKYIGYKEKFVLEQAIKELL